MEEHAKIVLTSWTDGAAGRQHTLSVCRECATFILEALHTGDWDHEDVRYFDSAMERMDPEDVRCTELTPARPRPAMPRGQRTWPTLREFHLERGGEESLQSDYGGYSWNNLDNPWLTREKLPAGHDRYRVSHVEDTGDWYASNSYRQEIILLGTTPKNAPDWEISEFFSDWPGRGGTGRPLSWFRNRIHRFNALRGEEPAGSALRDQSPATPNLDARLNGADTIRAVSAFMEHLGGSGYFLAGTPRHTHIDGPDSLASPEECWGRPGCPWENDPEHTPPDGERGDHIVRRNTPVRKLTDSFLGIDSEAASVEMDALLEHTRRRNAETRNAETENAETENAGAENGQA